MRPRRRHLLHTEVQKPRSHGCERAAMPSTVTYMPVLNPTNSPVICMPFYKHTLCKFNNGWLVKLTSIALVLRAI